jgi:hypothetical protein
VFTSYCNFFVGQTTDHNNQFAIIFSNSILWISFLFLQHLHLILLLGISS